MYIHMYMYIYIYTYTYCKWQHFKDGGSLIDDDDLVVTMPVPNELQRHLIRSAHPVCFPANASRSG